MAEVCIAFAWGWFLAGVLSGAVLGLGFHRERHMGGYASWPRRLSRLGHIAFFGTGLLCLAMGLSARAMAIAGAGLAVSGWALIGGAVAMPAVCFLSAWRKPLRVLFPIPVVLMTGGVGLFAVLTVQVAAGAAPG